MKILYQKQQLQQYHHHLHQRFLLDVPLVDQLVLPMVEADEALPNIIEGKVLATKFIEELLSLVDRGETDNTALLMADRERLKKEMSNLMDLVAAGTPAATVAPKIAERAAHLARVEDQLRTPKTIGPNIDKLREALTLRAE